MPSKGPEGTTLLANRCSCGHYASTHMIVRPVAEGNPGSFKLVPEGACTLCGARCPRFAPGR